jgi:transcription-repair coupling factor (superfamily II helicase)
MLRQFLPAEIFQGSEAQVFKLRAMTPSDLELLIYDQIFRQKIKQLVIVEDSFRKLSRWADAISMMSNSHPTRDIKVATLGASNYWGNDRFLHRDAMEHERLQAIELLQPESRNGVILTTLAGLCQKTFSWEELASLKVDVSLGEEYDQDILLERLIDIGYRLVNEVEGAGSVSVRGGIVDIFPSNRKNPCRLEFLGDMIDNVKEFDVESQRSSMPINGVSVLPAREFVTPKSLRKKQVQHLYDVLLEQEIPQPNREGILYSFDSAATFQNIAMFGGFFRNTSVSAIAQLSGEAGSRMFFPSGVATSLSSYKEELEAMEVEFEKDIQLQREVVEPLKVYDKVSPALWAIKMPIISANEQSEEFTEMPAVEVVAHSSRLPELAAVLSDQDKTASMQAVLKLLEKMSANNTRIIITSHYPEQRERVANVLAHREIEFERAENIDSALLLDAKQNVSVILVIGDLSDYVYDSRTEILLINDHLVLGGRAKTPKKEGQNKLKNLINSFRELSAGDLVVHAQHGIGKYCGMEALEVQGVHGDFLRIEYAGADRIFLPVHKLSVLQKYQASEAGSTKLDNLRSSSWEKRRDHVKKSIRDMAEKLIKLHAKRQVEGGFSFTEVSEDYRVFEASFPFDETPDQMAAINDVNEDMSRETSMDRLICGDVGFGKTEVAIRAAYRAVLDHKQVMILVPTTVLSYQHYRNFYNRMTNYGVRVAQLNRFVASSEAKMILADFERGFIDILIGTHRLLSTDVAPARLGLLIVDEEQRFGVEHKERIKEIRAGCDIITLTATPIPRTLHMSMVGLKDISIIQSPPTDRRAVKTFVTSIDEQVIKRAIEEELARGGQVFFVNNNVQDIESWAAKLKKLLPKARVKVGHGQMRERQLETVIVDFLERRFDVLVCTTIIESGVDMPNVNTLITINADRFGLAQLYQLRGRVGRSNRQAFAYFLVKNPQSLTDEAQRRLDVLLAHQELGSGFQIASHDLEIRGAGSLLGGEQSGRVSDVGLEMYTEMLSEAIESVKAEGDGSKIRRSDSERIEAEMKLPYPVRLPVSYINAEQLRLQVYKKIFSAKSLDEVQQFNDEIRDRFGAPSVAASCVLRVAELKVLLVDIHAKSISIKPRGTAELSFERLNEEQILKLLTVSQKNPQYFKLFPDYRLEVNGLKLDNLTSDNILRHLDSLIDVLRNLI